MPPDPKPTPAPPKTDPPPAPPAPAAPPPATEQRFERIEQEQQRQGGILQQILDKLGSGPAPKQDPDPSGKTVAELVREGVAQLEAEKQAKADADTAAAERADHASRIKALEEARPREVAATPAGKFRAAVQKYGFGIEQEGR